MAKVKVYGGLIQITGGKKELQAQGSSVGEVIKELNAEYGDTFKNRVLDEKGSLAGFVRILVNNRDIRFLQQLETKVGDEDVIIFMPAIGGG